MDIASLVYDVSKDLYSFYQKAKGREDDIKDIRAQLLWMGEKSVLVQEVLQRDGLAAENRSKVEDNMRRCEPAVAELRGTVAGLKTANQNSKGTSARLQARITKLGLMTAWPFKKETILALAGYVKTCHGTLDAAISLLQLNVSVSHIEELHKTDKLIIDGKKSLEDAFKELRSSVSAQLHQVFERLAEQTKLLLEQQNREKAQEIIANLRYTELEYRELQITELDDDSYAWIFTPEAQGIAEVQNLVHFLNVQSGLFWVSGEAASGKSTLMKFIARSPLWQWQGQKDVTTACHFCWIAGTAAQKTQIAMLQTLLYYILVAESGIVPDVCRTAWDSGVGCSPQSVRELRECLQTAVRVTKRRFCLFVDGLDELEPEGDHNSVIDFLKQVAKHGHVKIVLSSRPWSVFRSHHSTSNTMAMESVNTKAIAKYLQNTIGTLSGFQDVSWPCQNGSLKCKHNTEWDERTHGDAHAFIYHVICKAQGNFLWTCLVAKSIVSRSSAGFSMASTQKHIDDTPSDLNMYFRTIITERINQEWKSETAMALSIAQFSDTTWLSFWLLFNSLDGGLPSLESPDFALATPLQKYDIQSFRIMMQKTSDLLSTCCRDILDTEKFRQMIRKLGDPSKSTRDKVPLTSIVGISFPYIHRTIFEYLNTREMSELLEKHTPRSFHDVNFRARLVITEAKFTFSGYLGMDKIGAIGSNWTKLRVALSSICETQLQEGEGTIVRLAEEADSIALRYLLEHGHLFFEVATSPVHRGVEQDLISLCVRLADRNCYDTIDALLERWPAYTSQEKEHMNLDLLSFALNYHHGWEWRIEKYERTDTKLLRRLLAAGLDPNQPREAMRLRDCWSTPWCDFLSRIVMNEESSRETIAKITSTVPASKRSISCETFATPQIQIAIEYFLEYGAELELSMHQSRLQYSDLPCSLRYRKTHRGTMSDARIDPLATLRTWLPMDKGSKWPRILETYLQPTKQEEIRAARRRIVDNWPRMTKA